MNDITLMTLIAFILFMSTGVTGPLSSLYAESLGADYVAIGLLGTVRSLAAIVFGYVWGRASDLWGGRKQFLAVSLAALSLSYILIALVRSYQWLYPLRVLGALAQAGYGTASLALMGDLLERRSTDRGRRMGTFRGLASLGFGLMALISGSIADRTSLRVPFVMAAVLAAAAFVVALFVREPEPDDLALVRKKDLREALLVARGLIVQMWRESKAAVQLAARSASSLFARRSLVQVEDAPAESPSAARLPLAPLLVSALLWSLVTGAVYAVWANYMVGEIGFSPAAMTAVWALASTSEFPLMILAGWLSDRFGRLPMLSLGFLAWAVVFGGYVVAPVLPWIIGIQLVRGFAYSAYTATAMTYASEVRSRAQRGWASGLYSAAGGIGSIVGASVGGALTQLAGFRVMFASMSALILLGSAYLAVEALRHRRKSSRRLLERGVQS
jgi:SET family sugar efflux transporter-like MFS transporter